MARAEAHLVVGYMLAIYIDAAHSYGGAGGRSAVVRLWAGHIPWSKLSIRYGMVTHMGPLLASLAHLSSLALL